MLTEMAVKKSSLVWVLIQFTSFSVLLFTTPFIKVEVVSGSFMAAGLVLGVWALVEMRRSRFRILPEPYANTRLLTSGPYRFIRHPMYCALLLFSMGMLLIHLSGTRLFMAGLLFLVLHLKIRREEELLLKRFPVYADYSRHTKRLFPLLY